MLWVKVIDGIPVSASSIEQPDTVQFDSDDMLAPYDYTLIDGEWVYTPRQEQDDDDGASQLDRIEAQVLWTALMTDTLIQE